MHAKNMKETQNIAKMYNVIIGEDPSYIWFRVPKTGSSSMRRVLHQNTLVVRDVWACYMTPKNFSGHFTFTIVRNPYDRLISAWHDKVLHQAEIDFYRPCFEQNFEFFVYYVCDHGTSQVDAHVRSQCLFLPKQLDMIGRFEHFADDLRSIMRHLDKALPTIPHLKARPRGHYSIYYTAATRAAAQHYYRDDLERFAYDFQESPG